MKAKKTGFKWALASALIALLSLTGLAQTATSYITWDVSIPLADTKDFVNNSSIKARGISFQIRRQLRDNITVGFTAGWHVFNGTQEGPVDIESDAFNGTISGKQFRYVNAFPLMASIHYETGASRGIQAFIGLSGGGYILEERLEAGVFVLEKSRWMFGVIPEIGIKFPVTYDASGVLSVKYHYGFKNSRSLSGASTGLSYLSLNIGFSFDHGFI